MTILATATLPVVPTVAVTASSGGVAAPPPVNGEASTPQTASSGPPLPSARSRWKKLTGTAMFINRLGKTMQATRIIEYYEHGETSFHFFAKKTSYFQTRGVFCSSSCVLCSFFYYILHTLLLLLTKYFPSENALCPRFFKFITSNVIFTSIILYPIYCIFFLDSRSLLSY